jgi:hypothetical protein
MAALAVLTAVLLAACGSGSPKSASSSSSPSSSTTASSQASGTTTATTAVSGATGPSISTIDSAKSVTVGGKSVTVPIDDGKPVLPGVDDGQQIVISAGGILPSKLYANPSQAIVWTNLTDQSQQVKFDYFSVTSPVIPPGGTWSWSTQDSESIAFRTVSGMKAVVIVNPPGV